MKAKMLVLSALCLVLGAGEARASAKVRGLWSDPHPVNPHDFRKQKK